jgi:hypothetical protein
MSVSNASSNVAVAGTERIKMCRTHILLTNTKHTKKNQLRILVLKRTTFSYEYVNILTYKINIEDSQLC